MCRIRERLHEFSSLKSGNAQKTNPKLNELKVQLANCEERIDDLVKKIPKASDRTMKYINECLEQLDQEKCQLNEEILKLSDTPISDDFNVITKHAEQWETISFNDKQKVIDTLIDVIKIANGQITIDWKF